MDSVFEVVEIVGVVDIAIDGEEAAGFEGNFGVGVAQVQSHPVSVYFEGDVVFLGGSAEGVDVGFEALAS